MSAGSALSSSVLSVVPAFRLSLERARRTQQDLENWLFSEETMGLPLDELEREQERRSREVQRQLLQAHIEARGRGEVGPAIRLVSEDQTYTHRRLQDREVHTVFGDVQVQRLGYGARGTESIHPLDEELRLPERSYSYEPQRRVVKAAVQGPFDEAVERVEEATGVEIPKRSAEQMVQEAAADFDAFYAARRAVPGEQSGPMVVAAVDCKGIPMVKPEGAQRSIRRGKGEKANKKRMATVAAVFTQQPRVRTPEEVVESLFRSGPRLVGQRARSPESRPENKRVWASLSKSKDQVIAEVEREIDRRDPNGSKRRVAVTDGEEALQRRVLTLKLLYSMLILDLLHVLQHLWKAAHVFHREKSPQAEAWMKERVLRILRGEVVQVVKGLRQSATKRRLTSAKRKTLRGVAAYLYRNRAYMRYHEYLAEGLPIASGAVEGACKNLVKDRMERSGMRWTEPMAEAMLQLRATYLSDDFEEYWKFHVEQDQQRIHPAGRWEPVGASS
jgi:hypothetical protein